MEGRPLLFVIAIITVVGVGIFGAAIYGIHAASSIKISLSSPSPTAIADITPASAIPSASESAVLSVQTKTTDCHINGPLPDGTCTPGAIFPNVTKDQICQSGYAKSVRNVPTFEKQLVYQEYGITTHRSGEYEVDHLVSLELGGSNDLANLWPEPADPRPGFHEKDKVENYLHDQVCSGAISLSLAQQKIASNWLAIYDPGL